MEDMLIDKLSSGRKVCTMETSRIPSKEGEYLVLNDPDFSPIKKRILDKDTGEPFSFTFIYYKKSYADNLSFGGDVYEIQIYNTEGLRTHEENEIVELFKKHQIYGVTSHREDVPISIFKPVYFTEFMHYPSKTMIIRDGDKFYIENREGQFDYSEVIRHFY